MTTAIKLEKLKEMESTINKIENMITTSKQEVKSLEVEWLHLRGLVAGNSDDKSKQEPVSPIKNETNYDDVNKINSEQLCSDALGSFSAVFIKSNLSENQPENESSDEN